MHTILALSESDLTHHNLPFTCASAIRATSSIETSMVTETSATTEAQADHTVTSSTLTTPTLAIGTAPRSEEPDECITGNEAITDNNKDTCVALDSNMENELFMPLATIASHCIHITGHVFLDIITKGNTSCSVIGNKIYVKADRFGCKDALRLKRCKFVDVQSESNCRITCQCKEDFPCHLWHENSLSENFDICEISAVYVLS